MRLLFLFLILFSSYSYSEQDWTAIPSTYPDSVGIFSFDTYPPYHATSYAGARLHIGQCNDWQGSQVCFWADGRVWYSVELIPDEPPPDPYACSENLRRITFDGNPSFCSSANTCDEIIDYALAYDYQNGSCTDSRLDSQNEFCGDQSILCWTSDDQTNPPIVTTMDGGPTANPNSPPVPDVDSTVSEITDGDTTITNTESETTLDDGTVVTEKTTTSKNNVTGESTTTTSTTEQKTDGTISVTGKTENLDSDQTEASASGGDGCTIAPVCSGDPVGCLTAKQVWLNRCDKNPEVSGDPNNCSSTFSCTGDPVYCAALNFDRTNHCEGKTVADALGDNFLNDALSDGQTDLENQLGSESLDTDGSLTSLENIDVDIASLVDVNSIFNQSQVAASCPAPYPLPLQIGGMQHFDYQPFCDVLERLNPLVITIFSFLASMMIFRGLTETG